MRFDHFTTKSFGESEISEFLKRGSLLSADPDHFFVSWGDPLQAARASWFAPNFYSSTESTSEDSGAEAFGHFDVVHRSVFATLVLSKLTSNVNPELASEGQGFRWVEPSFEDFQQQVETIRNEFREGGLKKAVPVVFATAEASIGERKLLKMLQSLTKIPSTLMAYGTWDMSRGAGILGATPETLFSFEGRVLTTMALAGTQSKDATWSLLENEKEMREHGFVIEDIRTQLESLGKVEIGKTHVHELPTLRHLKTNIELSSKREIDFADVMKRLHPTPALGVSPRSYGYMNMRRWDNESVRGRFAAPFGVRLEGYAKCVVAIRGVQWSESKLMLGSGCGFLEESKIDSEWAELKLKRDSVKKVLDL